ncbi:MAG: hypothetical protein HKP25_14880 [Marinicaulis sp.]|nr:hypothetical protein [Marinicaulis sp.]
MSFIEPVKKLAGEVRRRLSRSSDERGAPVSEPIHVPVDPTVGLFGDSDREDSRAVLTENLAVRLRDSADDITRARNMLDAHAIDIQTTSAARDRGEKMLTVYGLRAVIGFAWLLLAFWLNQSALLAQAADLTVTASGMPIAHATALGETFMLAGTLAAGVAILLIALVFISGNGTNGWLRHRGEVFGATLADTATQFNETLKFYHKKITDTSAPPSAIVPAVSQAHLTALEAKVFFEDISFLTTPNSDQADGFFRDFLRRHCPPAPLGYALPDMLSAIVLGGIVGLFVGYKLFAPEVATTTAATPLAILQYPGALLALLGGVGVYAFIGFFIAALSGLFENKVLTNARKEALDSIRSAYLAAEAPLASEVTRQVDDVVQILQARLVPGARSNNTANHFPGEDARFADADSEIPEWRRRDTSVKFVDTGFASAPKEWRTDAFSKKLGEKSRREPEAKRGPDAPEKPPWR